MILNEKFTDILQNKNFIMFINSLFFMFGILSYFSGKEIIVAFFISLGLIVLMYLKLFGIKRIFILLLIFYSGFFLTLSKIKVSDDLFTLAPIKGEFIGRVVSIPNSTGDNKYKFFFEIEKIDKTNVKGKTLVSMNILPKTAQKLNIGQKLVLSGNLREPFFSTNPSQFDYSSYLRNFGAFTVLYSTDEKFKVIKERLSFKWKFLQELNTTRNRIIKIHSKYLKSPNLEILGGIVFGDDAVAPPINIKQSFANSGLLHILAASGMNVAFIFAFWVFLLKIFKVPYKIRIITGMGAIILYTLMTGLGASVVRASLMILFVLAGKLIDRDSHSVSLLSFVAVLMLIYNPAYINDVSFQMSFLVTFGLLTSVRPISEKIEFIPKKISEIILIPIIAQIWIAPVQMFYFNTFSLYSIFANIVSANIVSVISFGGFVSSLINIIPCSFTNYICKICDYILNYFLSAIVYVSEFFANLPNSIIETVHPHIFQMFFYYFVLLVVILLIKYNKYKIAGVTFLSSIIVILGLSLNYPNNNLEVIAFDVQNADSFLIKTPENKYFFIDTGKAPYNTGNTQAKIIMLKYLKDRGIKNIESVIVTHFDNDHSGGTVDFMENTNIKTLYLNSKSTKTQTAKNIYKTINKIHQNYLIAQNNKVIYEEPNLKIKTYKASIDTSNGASIITLLTYKDFEMLFMGDAGIDAFHNIEKDIPHNIDVFKVGHHGGPFVVDEKMLEHLNPKVSIISTGINYFGHPNKGTLDILRNTKILRTDFTNAIKIKSDGVSTKFLTYNSKRKVFVQKEEIKN